MKLFWVYFRGTRHGEYIQAETHAKAKSLFAQHENVPVSGYIASKLAEGSR